LNNLELFPAIRFNLLLFKEKAKGFPLLSGLGETYKGEDHLKRRRSTIYKEVKPRIETLFWQSDDRDNPKTPKSGTKSLNIPLQTYQKRAIGNAKSLKQAACKGIKITKPYHFADISYLLDKNDNCKFC
jgi:hypothetical protein